MRQHLLAIGLILFIASLGAAMSVVALQLDPHVVTITATDSAGETVHYSVMADLPTVAHELGHIPGDANFDGVVDLADLNLVLENFGAK